MPSNSKLFRADPVIRYMAATGFPIDTISNAVDASRTGVLLYCIRNQIEVCKPAPGAKVPKVRSKAYNTRPKPISERDLQMAHLHKQGVTLQKIGAEYGVTRERVRQVLKKSGIGRADGGFSVRQNQTAVTISREKTLSIARKEAKWGVDIDLWRELRANGTVRAYENQRRSSKLRGIYWGLTFGSWYGIWQASGKMHLRGRGIGHYCMSRIKDAGGYDLGNVHIQGCVENSREAVKKWKGKTKAIVGVFCLYPGREMAWLAKIGKRRLGYFASAELAGQARIAWIEAHPEFKPANSLGSGKGWTIEKNCTKRPYAMQFMGAKRSYHATQAEAEAAYVEAASRERAARRLIA